VSVMQSSFFHVVDRPFVVPLTLDQHAPAVKFALYALIAIVAAEALFVYVIARRDPRIRSVQDIRGAAGLKPLGSVPVLQRTRGSAGPPPSAVRRTRRRPPRPPPLPRRWPAAGGGGRRPPGTR